MFLVQFEYLKKNTVPIEKVSNQYFLFVFVLVYLFCFNLEFITPFKAYMNTYKQYILKRTSWICILHY